MMTLNDRLSDDYQKRLLRIRIEDYAKAHKLPFHEAATGMAKEQPAAFEYWQRHWR